MFKEFTIVTAMGQRSTFINIDNVISISKKCVAPIGVGYIYNVVMVNNAIIEVYMPYGEDIYKLLNVNKEDKEDNDNEEQKAT